MDNLDVFESAFKRALRDPFRYAPPRFDRVLVVADKSSGPAFRDRVADCFKNHPAFSDTPWSFAGDSDYAVWGDLEERIQAESPSLIITHRFLKEKHETRKFSLGSFLDTMTQRAACPVLVLPEAKPFCALGSVLAVADHLSGHDRLVNAATALTKNAGTLTLCHLEDEDIFSYYIDAIERIPEINTGVAREKISKQLLAAPQHYIDSVAKSLTAARPDLTVKSIVEIGHRIDRYRELIAANAAGLLVLESKDETQLAMHSLGHSLAVEFQEIPMLLV